eukprot:SAG22_NODE_570_length_9013_cov_4.251739_6_plen_32_part_00
MAQWHRSKDLLGCIFQWDLAADPYTAAAAKL